MKLSDFDFDLPEELIAQRPTDVRDGARLMVLEPGRAPRHARVARLDAYLREGDVLVFNDTRVLPARLYGRKASGGAVELLLIEPVGGDDRRWSVWLKCRRKPSAGAVLKLEGGFTAEVVKRTQRSWEVEFDTPAADVMDAIGSMPLPPYVRRGADDGDPVRRMDRERYQTVYARRPGAIAAPTAGLHFTRELLDRLEERGVLSAFVTLHVGIGTFQPVEVDDVTQHRMHTERFIVDEAAVGTIQRARDRGGRVVAVGTTSVRALETAAADGTLRAMAGASELFIRPGYRFNAVDALLTNFHLPRSTLLLLVSAFAGRQRMLDAYRLAVRERYRFFSYGDAMLLTEREAGGETGRALEGEAS